MSFTIEAADKPATYRMDHVAMLLDMARDSLPEDATQAQIDDMVVQYIIGDLRRPKRLATVRSHLVRYWTLIEPLAYREPDLFDQIMLEYAELATALD